MLRHVRILFEIVLFYMSSRITCKMRKNPRSANDQLLRYRVITENIKNTIRMSLLIHWTSLCDNVKHTFSSSQRNKWGSVFYLRLTKYSLGTLTPQRHTWYPHTFSRTCVRSALEHYKYWTCRRGVRRTTPDWKRSYHGVITN